MLTNLGTQVTDISTKVARRAVETVMAKHLHDGRQRATVAEQGSGHTSPEQVRVLTAPWALLGCAAHAIVSNCTAKGGSRPMADDEPYASTAVKGQSAVCHPKRVALTRPCARAKRQITLKQLVQFLADRNPATSTTFSGRHIDGIRAHVANAQADQFGGAQACLPQGAHQHAVTVAGEGRHVRSGQHGKHLVIGKASHHAHRHMTIGRKIIRFSLRSDAQKDHRFVEGAQRLQIHIDGSRRRLLDSPVGQPAMQQIGVQPVRCAAVSEPATYDADVQAHCCGRSIAGQDALKSRQRILTIHMQRLAFWIRALDLTVTARYHTSGPFMDPSQADKKLKIQTVI